MITINEESCLILSFSSSAFDVSFSGDVLLPAAGVVVFVVELLLVLVLLLSVGVAVVEFPMLRPSKTEKTLYAIILSAFFANTVFCFFALSKFSVFSQT